jgi:murein DD-endopeptidase MepM/ murein hydrolase activator NlpD
MKKISIIILALLSIALGTYYFLFSSILPNSNINHISIIGHASESLTIYGNETEEKLSEMIRTINHGHKSQLPAGYRPDYTLEIGYTDRDTYSLEMNFDVDDKKIYLYEPDSEKSYVLENENAGYFMMDKEFKDIYPHSMRPQGYLERGETKHPIQSSESVWSYKQADSSWATIEEGSAMSDTSPIQSNGREVFHITYDQSPTSTDLLIKDGETILYEESLTEGHFMPYSEEGTYTYELTSYWENDLNRGTDKATVDISVDLPVRFRMARTTATAGDFYTVYADFANPDEELFLEHNLSKGKSYFYNVDGLRVAFIPLNYWAKVGDYKITAYSDRVETGKENATTFDVKVKYKDFKKQYLYIDETIEKATRNNDAYSQYGKYFNPSRDTITTEKLWDGPFIAPVEGRISTEFGEMRYVNDALTSYRHSGTDYAVPKGTPVKAPNRGRVNLSMFLTLTGNTVVIDHGLGLFTVYFHMDSLNVEKNQMVNKGDIIGTVGSTGFSTGPHLHYTTSMGKTNFDSLLLSGHDPIGE